MKELKEKLYNEAQEHGALHEEHCPVNMEDPDECDCDNFKMVRSIINESVDKTLEILSHDIFENEEQRKAGVKIYLDN